MSKLILRTCHSILFLALISGLLCQSKPLLTMSASGIVFPVLGHTTTEEPFFAIRALYPFAGDIDLSIGESLPSTTHWLGTDPLGRDLLAYGLKAIRNDLLISIVLSILAILIGGCISAIWALNRASLAITVLIEALRSIPMLVLILISSQTPQPLLTFMGLHIASQWSKFAIVIRPLFEQQICEPYIIDAMLNGERKKTIFKDHLFIVAKDYAHRIFPYKVMQTIGLLITMQYIGYGFNAAYPSIGNLLLISKFASNQSTLIISALCCSIVVISIS